MKNSSKRLAMLGRLADIPRQQLFSGHTACEFMPNLSRHCGGATLFVKRDDCTNLAFGGNKVRQLEFYLGDAIAKNADTILITSAVQSNFVRTAAAAACKLGLDCHVQLEERVATTSVHYRESGNVLLDKLFGAAMHSYPEGEDEAGADAQLEVLANNLKIKGKNPYIIPLAPGHAPLGALGYVIAAMELLEQIDQANINFEQIFVGSGSGATHAGLLFGLRALGSDIAVKGVCVRRPAGLQKPRIKNTCGEIADLLDIENAVSEEDIILTDECLAPGYGIPSDTVLDAIALGARLEGLIVDPVYTGKVLAAIIQTAESLDRDAKILFLHTGGTPAIFAYQNTIEKAAERNPVGY